MAVPVRSSVVETEPQKLSTKITDDLNQIDELQEIPALDIVVPSRRRQAGRPNAGSLGGGYAPSFNF